MSCLHALQRYYFQRLELSKLFHFVLKDVVSCVLYVMMDFINPYSSSSSFKLWEKNCNTSQIKRICVHHRYLSSSVWFKEGWWSLACAIKWIINENSFRRFCRNKPANWVLSTTFVRKEALSLLMIKTRTQESGGKSVYARYDCGSVYLILQKMSFFRIFKIVFGIYYYLDRQYPWLLYLKVW